MAARWRPSALAVFACSAIAWIIALTIAWSLLARWVAWPVGALSQAALETAAPGWIRSTTLQHGQLEAQTNVEVFVPNSGGRRAELIAQGDPARYAYSLPILLGLLLAARGPRRFARAAAGALLLLPAQVFSLCASVLMQIALGAQGDRAALKVAAWQLDLLTYAYQLGTLILPTLVPLLLWLWLDRHFVTTTLVPGWTGAAGARSPGA
jgi:hypothetical protein